MAAGTVIAVLGYRNFVTNLSNFLGFLLVVLITWSAINLTDFYAIRHGSYDVAAFFDPDGGPYGKVAWPGLVALATGIAAEFPFIAQPDYTGPLVARLGGADISWIIGFIVPAAAYLLLTRRTAESGPSATCRRPDRLIPRALSCAVPRAAAQAPARPAPGARGLRPPAAVTEDKESGLFAFALPPGTGRNLTRHHAEPHPMHRRKPADRPGDDTR